MPMDEKRHRGIPKSATGGLSGMASRKELPQNRKSVRRDGEPGIVPSVKRYPAKQKATNIENQFRYALLRKGINFVEQASIGPWSIDFLIPDHQIVVEADGEFWHSRPKTIMKDRRKDAWLERNGYKVFHFEGNEIIKNPNRCIELVEKAILAKTKKKAEEKALDDNTEYEQWIKGSQAFQPRSIGEEP